MHRAARCCWCSRRAPCASEADELKPLSPIALGEASKDRSDRELLLEMCNASSTGTTTAGGTCKSLRASSSSGRSYPSNIKVLHQSRASNVLYVPPTKLDSSKVKEFREKLEQHGISLAEWGRKGAKAIEHLYWEVYEQRGCLIVGLNGNGALKRITRLVKIRLVAEILGEDHVLYSRMQFMHDGRAVERKQVPLRKSVWTALHGDVDIMDEEYYVEDGSCTEDWAASCRKALEERLGVSEAWQEEHLEEDLEAYEYHVEDSVDSTGYPGLTTLYCIHQVTFRVKDPLSPEVQCIGLPHGQEFATTSGDFNYSGLQSDEGLPIGTQLNIWRWDAEHSLAGRFASPAQKSSASDLTSVLKEPVRLIPRVPLPDISATVLADGEAPAPPAVPNPFLASALDTRRADWERIGCIARSIREPGYSLRNYYEDLSLSFPELTLYLLDEQKKGAPHGRERLVLSSGRTVGDEYQRTVGAFFSIYWLMRLDVDGKEGFSFGVDQQWQPYKREDVDERLHTSADKRLAFHEKADWGEFQRLLMDARLLAENSEGRVVVNEERLVALLALTAFHDIMKVEKLLPKVQSEHAPYHGYGAGDTIGDHDQALSYVMEHFPSLLPSLANLEPAERKSILFTQCKLQFNHGWFVQAEAPPGACLTPLRQALTVEHQGEVGSADVSLYFVHWLTDLAGAEPSPLGGSEKFVTKFPLPVLNSFVRSFECVKGIAHQTEAEVMESYLETRWLEQRPPVGPLPRGPGALCRLRLLCMAQANAPQVLEAFEDLRADDKEVLSVEMARTGCLGQNFSSELVPLEVHEQAAGPAFVVYYGPAFFQRKSHDSSVTRLGMLAEVYRCARGLWPAEVSQVALNVIIRIDTIKDLNVKEILEVPEKGDVWLMVKHNDAEAFVERSSRKKLNKYILSCTSVQVLDFAAAAAGPAA